jgi:hypothetical protein
MEQIRVCTYDGPGAQPIIRAVPWPKISKKAAAGHVRGDQVDRSD